jgi:predicted nuclease of predicted toxin-antitoxin system
MRFLVDAHLPPGLCVTLQTAGHDAVDNISPDQ